MDGSGQVNGVAMQWAWASGRKGTALLVLLAIAACADETGVARISLAEMADVADVTIRTVQRNLHALEIAGLLVVERVAGRSRTNTYQLPLEKVTLKHDIAADARQTKGDTVTPFPENGDTQSPFSDPFTAGMSPFSAPPPAPPSKDSKDDDDSVTQNQSINHYAHARTREGRYLLRCIERFGDPTGEELARLEAQQARLPALQQDAVLERVIRAGGVRWGYLLTSLAMEPVKRIVLAKSEAREGQEWGSSKWADFYSNDVIDEWLRERRKTAAVAAD